MTECIKENGTAQQEDEAIQVAIGRYEASQDIEGLACADLDKIYKEEGHAGLSKAITVKEATDVWTNPIPPDEGDVLRTKFPIKALPRSLQQAIEEISRVSYADPALVSLPGLGIAALQIGTKAMVCEKEGLLHHPSLFLVGVAKSGERKTSIFKNFLDGVNRQIESEKEDYIHRLREAKTHNDLIDEKVKNLKAEMKKKDCDEGKIHKDIVYRESTRKPLPASPRNYGDDITSPRLFQLLDEHGGAYGVFSSDARAVFNRILGIGNNDGATDEALYLNAMWGDAIGRQRIGNQEERSIPHPALTTCLFVQTDRWKDFAKSNVMRESGCIARISVVKAESRMGTRFEREDDIPFQKGKLQAFEEAILAIRQWKPVEPVVVRLDPQAAARRREFHNAIEAQLGTGGRFEDVQDIASKATSLAARFTLIFAILEQVERGTFLREVLTITERQWLNAQALEEYFLAQAINSVRENDIPEAGNLLNRIFKWLVKAVEQNTIPDQKPISFLSSEIGKGIGRTPTSTIDALISDCIKSGWLRPGVEARNKRTRYEVNPNLIQFAPSRDTFSVHATSRDVHAIAQKQDNSLEINDLCASRDRATEIEAYINATG